jgi:hypothetical protein
MPKGMFDGTLLSRQRKGRLHKRWLENVVMGGSDAGEEE